MHDPIAHMNRWRDLHRARGSTGGKGNAVLVDRRNAVYCPIRDTVARMRFATSQAVEQYRFDVCGDEWVHLCPF